MILHRALVKESLQTCGAVISVLLAVFLCVRVLGFLRQAVEGDIPAGGVLVLLLLKTISYLDILAPLALYVSVILVLGRWIRDNELSVIAACGMGVAQLLKPALMLCLIIGGMAAVFSLYLSPLAAEASRAMQAQMQSRDAVSGVTPGVFTQTHDGNGVYFVGRRLPDAQTFGDIFIYRGGADAGIIFAERGYKDNQDGDDALVLTQGAQYRVTPGVAEYGVLNFDSYVFRLRPNPHAGKSLPLKARPTPQLLRDPRPGAAGELHWRLSKIAMLPVLMVFALGFSSVAYRKQRMPGMLGALLVYFVYSNFLGFCIALIRKGAVFPASIWLVHLAFLALAFYFLSRRNRNLRLLPGLA